MAPFPKSQIPPDRLQPQPQSVNAPRLINFTGDPYYGMGLQGIEQQRQQLAETAAEPIGQIQSPWQGASYLANKAVAGIREGMALGAEQRTRNDLAGLIGGINLDTGPTSQQIEQAMKIDPQYGTALYEAAVKARGAEHWVDIEPPPGAKPGQMYQRNSVTGEVRATGGQAVTQIGSGETEFQKKAGEKLATSMSALADDAVKASGDMSKLGMLESFMGKQGGAVTGIKAWAASMGFPVEGADDIQAATAIISSLVPAQREPGTGTMSDADLALFKSALPKWLNQPGGNKKIMNTLKAIIGFRREQGIVAQKVLSGAVPMDQAYAELMKIKSPMLDFPLPLPPDISTLTPGQTYEFPNGGTGKWSGQGDPADEKTWTKGG